MPVGAGVPLERGRQKWIPLKRYFAVIGSYSVNTVADRYSTYMYMLLIMTSTGDMLFRFINMDDLERP